MKTTALIIAALAFGSLITAPNTSFAQEAGKEVKSAEAQNPTSSATKNGIRFEQTTFAELKAIAAKENKLIFIDAFTTWCGPCKQMAKNVFTDAVVGKYYNDRFINAKIDMEAGEGIEIARQYEVRAYPTYLFLAADGELVHRAVGSMPPSEFIMVGNAASSPEERISTWQKRYKGGERKPEFISAYFKRAEAAGLNVSADFQTYISDKPVEALLDSTTWDLYASYGTFAMTRELDFVKANRDKITKANPKADVNAKLKDLYWRPLNRAYGVGGAEGEQYKKLDVEFRGLKLKDGDKLADLVPVNAIDAEAEGDKFGAAVATYYKKHPDQNGQWLNSMAWSFYEHVADDKLLAVAEKMAKTALSKDASNYAVADTYASVLFKRGKLTEATKAATDAITLGLKQDEDVSGTQELIKKIKEASKAKKKK
jgi:thiol-disulfide isomerase/thioredoxin